MLDWARNAGMGDEVIRRMEFRVRRRRRKFIAVAIGGMTAGLVFSVWPFAPPEVPSRSTSTVILAPARQTLPDGSLVDLKEGAAIDIEFTHVLRRVFLRRGVAHFQLTKDPRRPFVVSAMGVEIHAVGTAFSVQLDPHQVDILVTEGKVRVTASLSATSAAPASAEPQAGAAELSAGERTTVSLVSPSMPAAAPPVVAVSPGELGDRLSWRVPRLEFVGTPLAEAIPLFNRHSSAWHGDRIALGDLELGQLQLSGIVRADNTAALLYVLAKDFGIAAETRGDKVIVLRKSR